jgi:hypothetical protein
MVVWTEVVAVMFPSLACWFLSGNVQGKMDQELLEELVRLPCARVCCTVR